MPQIYVIISPKVKDIFTTFWLEKLAEDFNKAVEEGFGLAGLDDTAFTAVPSLHTKREADVQVEIRYTAGKDEYNKGKPFDPSEKKQKMLIKKIKLAFDNFLKEYGLLKECEPSVISVSVWCKPYYKSEFKIFEK